jgi:hypothetical protein
MEALGDAWISFTIDAADPKCRPSVRGLDLLLKAVEPVQCHGQAECGVVVAGGLVRAHCDAAPLLELAAALARFDAWA